VHSFFSNLLLGTMRSSCSDVIKQKTLEERSAANVAYPYLILFRLMHTILLEPTIPWPKLEGRRKPIDIRRSHWCQ